MLFGLRGERPALAAAVGTPRDAYAGLVHLCVARRGHHETGAVAPVAPQPFVSRGDGLRVPSKKVAQPAHTMTVAPDVPS
jgi:hypothetical protein